MDDQNVLLVEDDVRLSELVGSLLTLAGYRPVIIADHALIPGAVDRWQPRCVIMDGELKSSGENRSWDDAAALRRGHPTLPVVMMTADNAALAEAQAGRSRRSRAAGFAGFVSKPFVVEEFLATLKSALEPSAPRAPSALAVPLDDAGIGNIILFPNIARPTPVDPSDAEMFDTVVHELRQPLTVIRGQLQLGRRHIGKDPVRALAAIDQAVAQVDRMTRLLSDLLDSARLASNALSLNVVAFDLVTVIADVVAMHEDLDTRRIGFEWPHGTVNVRGDSERIAQILDNLLSNATKYSSPGTPIEVTLTMQGAEVEVRVADHGSGIPDDERMQLFTPFYRAAGSSNVPGTGLGLHISRRLAERQGGRLWLEASSGAGSVFALALLLAPNADEVSSSDVIQRALPEISDRAGRTTA